MQQFWKQFLSLNASFKKKKKAIFLLQSCLSHLKDTKTHFRTKIDLKQALETNYLNGDHTKVHCVVDWL